MSKSAGRNSIQSKVAAVWCRVSTDSQRELSLDSQEAAVKKALEDQGYRVPGELILKVDWSSLDLMSCYEFQQLRQWIADGTVQAVGTLDRDRFQAQGLQRLLFLSECQDYGVEIVAVQGAPMLGGGEGQLVELALALGKERSVLRAQQGAKDGLRDRAKLKGLPLGGKPPYGYIFRYNEIGTPVALDANPTTFPILTRIWRLALEGIPLRGIARELTEDGIPTAKGGTTWSHTTIAQNLKNPAYSGRYHALRFESKEPQRRRKGSYGKSSHRTREDGHYLEGFPITAPVVTWAEFEYVQERLNRNKLDSKRRSIRLYIMAGILFCGADGRRMVGHSFHRGQYYRYECTKRGPKGQTKCLSLRGSEIEDTVWETVSAFLSDPEVFLAELDRRRGKGTDMMADVRKAMDVTDRGLRKVAESETELVLLKVTGQVSEEAFASASALLKAKRTHLKDESERQQAALATEDESQAALDSLEAIRDRIADRLKAATPEDRRWVLQALATRVTVLCDSLEVSIGVPADVGSGEGAASVRNPRVLISRTKLAMAGRWALDDPR